MREHLFLPKPRFPRHVCYPDFIGGYRNYPEHSVRREYRTTENHLDRFYNLHLVLDGKGFLDTGSRTYELGRGQGFLYGPGLRQSYRSDAREPWNIRWVHFFGVHLEELLEGKGLDEPWLFRLEDPAPTESLIERMLELGRDYEVDDEFRLASLLYELLVRLQASSTRINIPATGAEERIRAAANYVRAHSREPVTLEEAAAVAGYSPHYFSRRFSGTTGMSFPDFLLESRLLHAKRLLASTSLPIKQIALETGFSQTSYFSACFKRREQMTPHAFRERHRL